MPNDDRLFPGRMDTQVGVDSQTDGEWAVDKILSHAGSKTDSTFEIKWRSGDITWLPYYQITHLQALTDYLELLGIDKITKLPTGKGHPPENDPQIFVGALSLSHHSRSPYPLPTLPFSFQHLNRLARFFVSLFPSFSTPSVNSITVDFTLPASMPPRSCVDHPFFSRLSPTQYVMKSPGTYSATVVHVGQIAIFLQFDEEVRTRRGIQGIDTIPLGFTEFADAWNEGVRDRDPRRISKVILTDKPDDHFVDPSNYPVYIRDFYITPEQSGLGTDTRDSSTTTSIQNEIMQEYAAMMLKRQHHQRRGYEERKERRLQAYAAGPINPRYPFFTNFDHLSGTSKRGSSRRSSTSASEISAEAPFAVHPTLPETPVDEAPAMETAD